MLPSGRKEGGTSSFCQQVEFWLLCSEWLSRSFSLPTSPLRPTKPEHTCRSRQHISHSHKANLHISPMPITKNGLPSIFGASGYVDASRMQVTQEAQMLPLHCFGLPHTHKPPPSETARHIGSDHLDVIWRLTCGANLEACHLPGLF